MSSMKIGDLVRPVNEPISPTPLVEEDWVGIVVEYPALGDPIIYWNDRFPAEAEYRDQLEVISESR